MPMSCMLSRARINVRRLLMFEDKVRDVLKKRIPDSSHHYHSSIADLSFNQNFSVDAGKLMLIYIYRWSGIAATPSTPSRCLDVWWLSVLPPDNPDILDGGHQGTDHPSPPRADAARWCPGRSHQDPRLLSAAQPQSSCHRLLLAGRTQFSFVVLLT